MAGMGREGQGRTLDWLVEVRGSWRLWVIGVLGIVVLVAAGGCRAREPSTLEIECVLGLEVALSCEVQEEGEQVGGHGWPTVSFYAGEEGAENGEVPLAQTGYWMSVPIVLEPPLVGSVYVQRGGNWCNGGQEVRFEREQLEEGQEVLRMQVSCP